MLRRACVTFLILLVSTIGQTWADEEAVRRAGGNGDPLSTGVVDGRIGPGALYRLVRPTNWNGSLLIYAHGHVAPDQPIALPAEADLLVNLLAPQGFAVAYSSFSENGWAVKDGAQRTHQLLGIFKSKFGAPTRVYIGGASMGGLIAVKLAETYPGTYAGALPACAACGGTRRLFDYHAHTRTLFDFFYPGALPGTAAFLPPGTDIATGIIGPATAAITANPIPVLTMALIDQTPFPGATPAELVESIVTALAGNAGTLADLQALTNGKPYFDNRSTNYSSALLPAALLQAINDGVGRFTASPSALQTLGHNYEPSGNLSIPMLMLSNAGDPVVPGFNQASYLAAVLAAGAGDFLVQHQVPAFGHCVFTPAELGSAFAELVLWVEYGATPANGVRGLANQSALPAAASATLAGSGASATAAGAGLSLALYPPRANPSRDGTVRIEFALPDDGPARLTLVDIAGRLVASRDVSVLGPGRHGLILGQNLNPGVYLVRLSHERGLAQFKVAVTR